MDLQRMNNPHIGLWVIHLATYLLAPLEKCFSDGKGKRRARRDLNTRSSGILCLLDEQPTLM